MNFLLDKAEEKRYDIYSMESATESAVITPAITAVGKLSPLRQSLTLAETTDYSEFIFLAKIGLLALIGVIIIIIGVSNLQKKPNRRF